MRDPGTVLSQTVPELHTILREDIGQLCQSGERELCLGDYRSSGADGVLFPVLCFPNYKKKKCIFIMKNKHLYSSTDSLVVASKPFCVPVHTWLILPFPHLMRLYSVCLSGSLRKQMAQSG